MEDSRSTWCVCCVGDTQLYGANPRRSTWRFPRLKSKRGWDCEARTCRGFASASMRRRRRGRGRCHVDGCGARHRRRRAVQPTAGTSPSDHAPSMACRCASQDQPFTHRASFHATTSLASVARDVPRTVSRPAAPEGRRAHPSRHGGFSDASFHRFQRGHWSFRFLLRRFVVLCPPFSVDLDRSTSNGGFIGTERNP